MNQEIKREKKKIVQKVVNSKSKTSGNRSQMTSKCGKSKNVAHEDIAEGVTDVVTTF